jgi:Cu+-exporting ATPase
VTLDNGDVEAFDLVDAVREAGYDVLTSNLTLAIGGMTCVSYAAHVEGALSDTPSVVSASVNLAMQRAHITLIPGMAGQLELKAAVDGIGYKLLNEHPPVE